jgi:hypothetical protein
MEPELTKQFMDLGVTGAFLIYLYIKNGRAEKIQIKLAEALDKVNASQDRNTKVLIKVAQKHKLLDDADDLIEL